MAINVRRVFAVQIFQFDGTETDGLSNSVECESVLFTRLASQPEENEEQETGEWHAPFGQHEHAVATCRASEDEVCEIADTAKVVVRVVPRYPG